MVSVERQDCYRRWCSDTRLGRLCACARETSDDTEFSLDGRTWRVADLPPLGGEAGHFRIDDAGDGRLFLAMLSSESAGIAISNWHIWAIDAGHISRPLQVQNYGTLSFAARRRASRACQLLSAQWHSGTEPRRGPGTYLAGTWYALEGGEFERMRDRPTIYQRYLFRVERGRYDAEADQRPFPWFRHASTVAPRSAAPLYPPR